MAYQLHGPFSPQTPEPAQVISADDLRRRIDDLLQTQAQRFRRLWFYYRNPMLPRTLPRDEQGSDRPYRQAQEWGLPSRVTGARSSAGDLLLAQPVDGVARKEIVIENDIGWRIDTMIDFLFGRPISIVSACPDKQLRSQIELLLAQILTHNGGQLLLQQMALLGAVYGFVDVLVKLDSSAVADHRGDALAKPSSDALQASQGSLAPDGDASLLPHAKSASRAQDDAAATPAATSSLLDDSTEPGASSSTSLDASLARIARAVRLEVVEPARALPFLSDLDWREVNAYVQVWRIPRTAQVPRAGVRRDGFLARLGSTAGRLFRPANSADSLDDDQLTITEVLTPDWWQRYQDQTLVAEGINSLHELPLVHIQNLAVPFQYSGASDVEQLIPLQDELNTRLCDRANRITMQSFKMYLGKGIDGFTSLPVAPGRMWMTDNDDAEVIEFGGDTANPSEDQHIQELREAMDKISGVTPIAAGAIRGRIGNLTSAAALRVTMMALLAKTQRKRTTYGQAIERICELALSWLDCAGIFRTTPDQRRVQVRWPDLLPDFPP